MGTKMPTLAKWELNLPKIPATVPQIKKKTWKTGECSNLKWLKYMRNGNQNAVKYTKMGTKTAENPVGVRYYKRNLTEKNQLRPNRPIYYTV